MFYFLVQKILYQRFKFSQLAEIKILSPNKDWTHVQRRKFKHNKADYYYSEWVNDNF